MKPKKVIFYFFLLPFVLLASALVSTEDRTAGVVITMPISGVPAID